MVCLSIALSQFSRSLAHLLQRPIARLSVPTMKSTRDSFASASEEVGPPPRSAPSRRTLRWYQPARTSPVSFQVVTLSVIITKQKVIGMPTFASAKPAIWK